LLDYVALMQPVTDVPQSGWIAGSLMNSGAPVAAALVTATLLLAGCGKPSAGTQISASEESAPAAVPQDVRPPLPAQAEPLAAATNEAPAEPPTPAGELAVRVLASPFAASDMALKESFSRALIALQIADYPTAMTELEALAATPGLTPEQQQTVRDLMAQTLKLAPELAASRAAAAGASNLAPASQFAVTVPGASGRPGNVPESAFTTADPSVKRSFARAKAAFDIGSFDQAMVELQGLATNGQLNWQQRFEVDQLLVLASRALPTMPAQAPGQAQGR
jgi:hypothetical protein